jgi:hypothetical protein
MTQARRHLADGLSVRATARLLGISHVTLLKHLGPRPRPPQWPATTVLEVRQRAAAGETTQSISASLRVPYGTAQDWIWGRTRLDAGGPTTPRIHRRDTGCERLCRHWASGGCGLSMPPEDWSPRWCASFTPRA